MSVGGKTGAGAAAAWRGSGAVVVKVMVMCVSVSAHAERWLVEDSVNTRLETNDNVSLSAVSPGRVNSLFVSGALDASRQLENEVTRLKTDVTLVRQQGAAAQDRVDGQWALTQSLLDPINTVTLTAQYLQDFNNLVSSADVTQGQGRRRTTAASVAWTRALTERLGATAQLSADRTAYGAQLDGAVDYRDAVVSAGLNYLTSEIASVGVQVSRSIYRAADDRNRSDTGAVNLSWSQPTGERTSGALSLGLYRTTSISRLEGVACPLPLSFCSAGLVAFVPVEQQLDSTRRGVQFSGSYRMQIDEVTETSFAIARQQSPSGSGALVRNDTLNLSLSRAFSPTLGAVVGYVRSRSTLQDVAGASQPGQSSFSAALTQQLASDLSLQITYQRSQSDATGATGPGRSNSLSISLKYAGPTIDVAR